MPEDTSTGSKAIQLLPFVRRQRRQAAAIPDRAIAEHGKAEGAA